MKTNPISAWTAILLAALLASSCTSMKPEREDVSGTYIPEQFNASSGVAEHQTRWWEAFGSAQLNRLMQEAFLGNLTLEQASARLQQAEATARKRGAAEKLQLNGRADASTQQRSGGDDGSSDTSYSLGLYASYELDLWGRLGYITEAAVADWKASAFDLQTAAMTLSAELTDTYFEWLAQNEVLAIYESQLASSRNKLDALRLRYRTGQATSLAVLQQRQQVAGAEAKLPPVRAAIRTSEHRMAILTGSIPGADLGLSREALPGLPPQPATGLPITLLENRPDIQAARLALESADLSIGAARAARLPSIFLTASGVTSAEDIADLFDDWIAKLAGSLVGPLMDGGERKADVDRAEAVARERIAAYQQVLLKAIQETEDALSNEQHQVEYLEALGHQYTAAQNSETESIRRFQRGALSYLDTLTAVVLRESLEITQVQANTKLLADRVQLYRALGGDWSFILETN